MKKNTSLPCMIGHIKWPSTLTPSDSYADCKCGGVIIRTNFVLTAGHCVDEDESYVVRAGTKYCTWYGDMYDVKNKILHPHYTLEPLKNDIAILETEKRIIFSEDVQLIVMAEENFNSSDLYVQISGYGRTSFEGPNSPQLMKIEDTALSDDECSEYRPTIPDGAFCHIDRKHRWTSCKGDSRGPVTPSSTLHFLVGIVSSDIECELNNVALSSSIPKFRSWIRSETKV